MSTNYSLSTLTDPEWVPTEEAVLCFIFNGEDVLLINKKTGLGKGLINAPGGRVEEGESPADAAIRECREEVCLNLNSVEPAGMLYFQFTDGYSLKGHVFTASYPGGSPQETDEADPFWVHREDIPFDKMWADDVLWIPLMLKRKPFSGYFIFNQQKMLEHHIEIWED